MPYPITVNARSAAVETSLPGSGTIAPDGTLLVLDITATRTSAMTFLYRASRAAPVEVVSPMPELAIDVKATFTHNFAGIGANRIYLPSFPQWDRQNTSYPFAF